MQSVLALDAARKTDQQPRGKSLRRRAPILALLLFLPFIFLFARLPPIEIAPHCVSHVTIARWVHFWHVCDSYSFTEEMMKLPHYLTEPNPFRSRPVYVLAGAGLASVLRPAALPIRTALLDGHVAGDGDFALGIFLDRVPEYFALTAINFLILGTALWMAMRLVDPGDGTLAAALGAAIATSDMVHGMFWTQHSNFLNVIVPLGCITCFILGCRARQTRLLAIAALGLAVGVLILAYASIVIWLPAYVLGALYRDFRMASGLAETTRGLFRIVTPLALGGLGPVLSWWAFNTFYVHLPLSYEATTLRQFLWLADAWRDGRLGAALAEHWHGYLSQAWAWLGFAAPVSIAGVALFIWLGRRQWPATQAIGDPILIAVLLTIVCMLIFNFLQGYSQPRLVGGITLALFVALARCAQKADRPQLGALLLLAITAGQVVYAFLEPAISLP
jgi:hypothetical protein